MVLSLSALALSNISTKDLLHLRNRFSYGFPTMKLGRISIKENKYEDVVTHLIRGKPNYLCIFATDGIDPDSDDDERIPDPGNIRTHCVVRYLPNTIVITYYDGYEEDADYSIRVYDKHDEDQMKEYSLFRYDYQYSMPVEDDDNEYFVHNVAFGFQFIDRV